MIDDASDSSADAVELRNMAIEERLQVLQQLQQLEQNVTVRYLALLWYYLTLMPML